MAWVLTGPTRRPHQQDGLAWRHETFGTIGTKGGAGFAEIQGAKPVATEITVFATRLFDRITTELALCHRSPYLRNSTTRRQADGGHHHATYEVAAWANFPQIATQLLGRFGNLAADCDDLRPGRSETGMRFTGALTWLLS